MNKLHPKYGKQLDLPTIKKTVWITIGALEYYHSKFSITTQWNGLDNYIFTVAGEEFHFDGTLAQAEIRFNELKTKYIFDYEQKLSNPS